MLLIIGRINNTIMNSKKNINLLIVLIVIVTLIKCNTKEDKCCRNKFIVKKRLCLTESLWLGEDINQFLKLKPTSKMYYDEGLEDHYIKCPGDKSYYENRSLLIDSYKINQLSEYTFCDSILTNTRFSFKLASKLKKELFIELLNKEYPCLQSLTKSDSSLKMDYSVGVYSDSSRITNITIRVQ